jgi:hypothetical protein
MANRRDICIPRKKSDGSTYWVKIGTCWSNEKGDQLVFDALPLPDAEGRCVAMLFEPRDNDRKRSADADRHDARARGGPQNRYEDDGDVPF